MILVAVALAVEAVRIADLAKVVVLVEVRAEVVDLLRARVVLVVVEVRAEDRLAAAREVLMGLV